MQTTYPSKLLLFGEYTVLCGSQALAVPLHQWKGWWEQTQPKNHPTEDDLPKYIAWLKSTEIISAAIESRIVEEAQEGWKYEADIPIGFGLGSSGAFVAGIFDRFIANSETDIKSAHKVLSKMEGYFHGSSSGMDPMVSYTAKALYKSDQGDFHVIDDPGWPAGFNIFLLDTGLPRTTGTLVNTFNQMLQDDSFNRAVRGVLLPMMEHAIHFYLSGAAANLSECIEVISVFQRKYFDSFIPETTKQQWDQLVNTNGVYVKFCGAGGGGYFLVITTPDFNGSLPDNAVPIEHGSQTEK